MEEQEELRNTIKIDLWFEIGSYISPNNHDIAKSLIDKALLTAIHKAYILGGRECLKTIKG